MPEAAVAEPVAGAAPAAAAPAAPTPAAPADPKASGSAAPAAPAAPSAPGAPSEPAKGYWPDDWLTRVSKGDEKIAKQLGRYQSPEALAEAHIALRRRMDSGEVRPVLPKEPKPDELKAWRKDNGIPDKADGYDLKGIEIPKEDKGVVDGIVAKLHGVNAAPEVVRTAIESYYAEQTRQADQRAARDEEQRTTALDALNQEWGGQFRRNVNLVEGVLSKFPEKVRDALKSARLPDGTALFNNPDALRGFAALALEINPAGIIAPAGGGDLAKSMIDQYNDIQKEKQTDRKAFNKDAGKQEHERNLIDAMIKQGIMDKDGKIVQQKKAA